MQGSMDDLIGKVWTALAGNGEQYCSFLGLSQQVKDGMLSDLAMALKFWDDAGEIDAIYTERIGLFRIKDNQPCHQNAPECATYADFLQSLPSAERSKYATGSARKNGSVKRGKKRVRKDA